MSTTVMHEYKIKSLFPSFLIQSALQRHWLVGDGLEEPFERREDQLRFHVSEDEYFVTLATILDLLRQREARSLRRDNKILSALKDDLLWLQKHYMIVRRETPKSDD